MTRHPSSSLLGVAIHFAKWKNTFWIFFFSTSSSRGSVFVPEATLPTCDYSAGPGQMLRWIWARCWVPCTRRKAIALVQDMVQTQLFQCTSSWNRLTCRVFSSESQFEHLTVNNKEWGLKCAKSLQQAQVQSIYPNSSFLTAPQLSARQVIHSKQPSHGTNFQQAKNMSTKALLNQSFTFLTTINCSLRVPDCYGKVVLSKTF